MNTIWFDMDGTIYDLYKMHGWLEALRAENWEMAFYAGNPRAHIDRINQAIEALIEAGWQVGVITWAPKGYTRENIALDEVRDVKFRWLCEFCPALADGKFACIPYGESKAEYLLDWLHCAGKLNYLVDDNREVREEWRSHSTDGCTFKTINASRAFYRELEGLVM